jgi:ABC-type phosphate transport system substrate-binding protein
VTRKRNLIAAVALGLLTAAISVSAATADPSGPPTPRALNGVGSDTIQGVENALAGQITDGSGNRLLGSWDAVGSATISTVPGNAACTINRPNGSNAGRAALETSLQANDGCLQYARSSKLDLTTAAPVPLTYVPFAVDAVTYAVTGGSNVPRQLALTDVKAIYHCDPNYVGTGPNFSIKVLLPQAGSGTRSFWESTVGITDADVTAGKYPCISDKSNGQPIEEHDGRVLDNNAIAPFSIAQYIAQASNTITDHRGQAVLGTIDGLTPTIENGNFGVTREVYNVIPTNKVADPSYSSVFVGPSSKVCQSTTTINQFGFATDPNCGSTSSHT